MKFFIALIVLFYVNSLFSFNDKSVVIEIGKDKVTLGELKHAYEKNLNNSDKGLLSLNKKEFNNFLNLYTDYKLKVLDAIDKGFLNDTSVLNEIKMNRDLIAKSFYLDKVFETPHVNEILANRMKEFRFAYIIIPYNSDSIEGNSKLKAFEAIARIKKGEDFGEIAGLYSKDLKSSKNGGEVESWVTGGQLQKHLEIPLLSLKPGEVYPSVIETSYGYFIVKLIDIKQRKYYKGGHILVQLNGTTPEDTLKAYDKMKMIKSELKKGVEFEKIS